MGCNHVIVTLAGDFLAPSVLSSLDNGKGMVDALNAVPVTHVCFGNHENDVPLKAQLRRMVQFKGTWLNTNMPDYPATPAMMQPNQILDVKSADGSHTRKVALLGLMTAERVVHRAGAFGGAMETMVPVQEAAVKAAAEMAARGDIDAVVPLTHQDMADDVALSRAGLGFPVILGGPSKIALSNQESARGHW